MFAKLHFNNTTSAALTKAIVDLLTGTTNKQLITGQGYDANRSFITTAKNAAGWTLEYTHPDASIYILSAPCADSTKKKYVRFQVLPTAVYCNCGYVPNGSDLGVYAALSTAYSGGLLFSVNTTYHNAAADNFELRVSASARHFIVTAGIQGYATGRGVNVGSSAIGTVSAIFEHTCADSYFTDATEYVPVVQHHGRSNDSDNAVSYSGSMFSSPKYRNLKLNAITDIEKAAARGSIFTRNGSDGNLATATLGGSGRLWTSESDAVKALFPFGVSNNTYYFRGGSISDLCDVYLAAPGAYSDFVEIKVGSSETVYSMWNIGYGGYYFAVPKG